MCAHTPMCNNAVVPTTVGWIGDEWMRTEDPGLYDYLPYYDRPKIEWPGGVRRHSVRAEYRALRARPAGKSVSHIVAAPGAGRAALRLA